MGPILCVGLVCIDKFLLVKSYPEEDSDQPALEAYKSRGGNASNNCTVLAQFLPEKVIFLGALAQEQCQFIQDDFKINNIKVSECCPVRKNVAWPGIYFNLNLKYLF